MKKIQYLIILAIQIDQILRIRIAFRIFILAYQRSLQNSKFLGFDVSKCRFQLYAFYLFLTEIK